MKLRKISAVVLVLSTMLILSSCIDLPLPGWREHQNRTTEAVIIQTTEEPLISVSYTDKIYVTNNWITYSPMENGGNATLNMSIPSEWTLDNSVATNQNGEKVMEIQPVTHLLQKQAMLETYGKAYKGEKAQEISKSIVTLEHHTAKLLVEKDDASYIYKYFVQINKTVASICFFAKEENADTSLFERCVDTVSVDYVEPTTQSTTEITDK